MAPDAAVPGRVGRARPPPRVVVGVAVGRVPEGPVEVEGVEKREDEARVPRRRRAPVGARPGRPPVVREPVSVAPVERPGAVAPGPAAEAPTRHPRPSRDCGRGGCASGGRGRSTSQPWGLHAVPHPPQTGPPRRGRPAQEPGARTRRGLEPPRDGLRGTVATRFSDRKQEDGVGKGT